MPKMANGPNDDAARSYDAYDPISAACLYGNLLSFLSSGIFWMNFSSRMFDGSVFHSLYESDDIIAYTISFLSSFLSSND